MKRFQPPAPRRKQHGAATLIVVMVLFFIISLVAAYTNRNLIFEQRTSANQYRSTQALEVAEAGLEWAVSQLNFGRITSACAQSTNITDTSFRQRYLVTDPVTGKITPAPNPAGGELTASCVWAGATTGWDCSCPSTGATALTPPSGGAQAPAFRVRFRSIAGDTPTSTVPRQPGAVWVQVVGCTRLDVSGSPCLTFGGQGALNEGRVVVSSMLAVGANAVGLPLAPLTANGNVGPTGGGSMDLYNTATGGTGIAVHASGTVNSVTTRGAPGSPRGSTIIQNDSRLNLPAAGTFSAADRMFASIFNMRPQETFRPQQAAVELSCTLGCSAATVRSALALNPGRPLWLTGALNVDSAGDIGSATEPALLVVNGPVNFATSGVNINGLVYIRLPAGTADWVTSGTGRITGAVVIDGGVSGNGDTTLVYDGDILQRVRYGVGSFVRVPGSWRDFQ